MGAEKPKQPVKPEALVSFRDGEEVTIRWNGHEIKGVIVGGYYGNNHVSVTMFPTKGEKKIVRVKSSKVKKKH